MSYGLCECGCGEKTSIAKQSYTRSGTVRGEPVRYLVGHNLRGETGERARRWKGDDVGRIAAHLWLLKAHPTAGRCEHCGRAAKTHHAFKGENGGWSRNPNDYLELCPSCHKRFDLAKVKGAAENGNHGKR